MGSGDPPLVRDQRGPVTRSPRTSLSPRWCGPRSSAGAAARTQMFYAATSYYPPPVTSWRDHTEIVAALPASLRPSSPGCRGRISRRRSGHLDGYTSAYCNLPCGACHRQGHVLRVRPADLLALDVAARYRDCILAPVGPRTRADLVEDFLGRPTLRHLRRRPGHLTLDPPMAAPSVGFDLSIVRLDPAGWRVWAGVSAGPATFHVGAFPRPDGRASATSALEIHPASLRVPERVLAGDRGSTRLADRAAQNRRERRGRLDPTPADFTGTARGPRSINQCSADTRKIVGHRKASHHVLPLNTLPFSSFRVAGSIPSHSS